MFDRPSDQPNRTLLIEGIHDAYGLVWGKDDNSNLRQDVEYGTGIALAVSALMIKGKLGYAAFAGLSALDQARAHDTVEHQVEDMALGTAKGLAMRGAYDYIGSRNWSNTRKLFTGLGTTGALMLISRPGSVESASTSTDHRPSPATTDVSGFRSTEYVPRFNQQNDVASAMPPGDGAISPGAAAVSPGDAGAAPVRTAAAEAGANAALVGGDAGAVAITDGGTIASAVPIAQTDSMARFAPSDYGEVERMLAFEVPPDQLAAAAGLDPSQTNANNG